MLVPMAQGRESPTGYEWEEHTVLSEPEPLTMPERAGEGPRGGADRVGPTGPEPRTGRRGALPAWAIVAIEIGRAHV